MARFQELRTARAHRFVVFKVDDSLPAAGGWWWTGWARATPDSTTSPPASRTPAAAQQDLLHLLVRFVFASLSVKE
jgi:hypothetical protein